MVSKTRKKSIVVVWALSTSYHRDVVVAQSTIGIIYIQTHHSQWSDRKAVKLSGKYRRVVGAVQVAPG